MQKPTNRILSVLLVLVMVLSMLPATVFATSETDALEGWNIALGDDIGVKFHLNSADYTVTATVNGVEVNPTISDKVATVNVAAAQMNDTIALTVKNGEETVHTGEYSVRQYAETILNGEYDAEVKQMVKEMLNYGAAAQTYFAYNSENLANSGITVDAAVVPTEVPEITVEDNLSGISLYGMSLVFRNKTAVRFYFNVSGDIADYTFSQGTPVAKDNMYYIEIGDINPQDLDNTITMEVSKGEEKLTVSYSPLNYIIRKYNNSESSDSLKALVQAMYGYHIEAEEYASIIWAGTMSSHSNGWNADALYFTMAENAAPIGDGIRYIPTAESNIKLIRDGVTYDVAHTERESLVKSSETGYYIPLWVLGDYKPLVENDILIVSGSFKNAANNTTINISKSYVLINGDGTAEFSTEMPTLPTIIDAGVMSEHSNGWNADALYFTMAENAAPIGDAIRYIPEAEANIQLIRDGVTYNVGHTARETIVKSSETAYYIALWTLGDYKPLVANDILVVEGNFTNAANKTTLNISKSYVLINGDGTAEFSTEMPTLPTIIDAGVMSEHSNGWNADALYFSMAENAAPIGDAIRYIPEAEANIQLIRDGATYNVGHTARETIVKSSETAYYIALWVLGDYKPLVANDILVVEGNFTNAANKTTLNISKSYVLINADGTATFSTTEPVPSTTVDCGTMSEHADGSVSEIYFAMSENAVPVDENAEIAYAGTVQLVSGETTSSVSANIYKLDEGCYYLELDGVELADGDYLVVEGAFSNADNGYILNITKTYVLVDGDALVYSTTEPVVETVIEIGSMSSAPQYGTSGVDFSDGVIGNIYGTTEANEAPFDGWNYEYAPVSAENLKLIRDGVTYNVGIPGSGTIVKFNETAYCVKAYAWTVSGSKLPLVPGDILVVEGKYNQTSDSSVVVNFAPTYILVTSETTVKLMSTMPNVVSAGTMTAHGNDRTANGFYAKTDANNAAYTPIGHCATSLWLRMRSIMSAVRLPLLWQIPAARCWLSTARASTSLRVGP